MLSATAHAERHLSAAAATDDSLEAWEDYVETTNDPGNTLIVIALFVSALSFLGLPLITRLVRFCSRHKRRNHESSDSQATHQPIEDTWLDGALGDSGNSSPLLEIHSPLHDPNLSYRQRSQKMLMSALQFVIQSGVRWRGRRGTMHAENMDRRRIKRGVAREAQESIILEDQNNAKVDVYFFDECAAENSMVELVLGELESGSCCVQEDGYQPPCVATSTACHGNKHTTAATEIVPITTQHMRPRNRSGFSRRFLLAKAIVRYDEETKRILQLAVPFTCSSLVSTVSDLAILVIISETLGNEPTIAYIMVDAIVGVTSSFTGGWIEALSSLGSMAYGAENYDLVGRYAQTSVIVYVLSEIPFAFLWGFNIGKVILLMGFSENIAVMSEGYVWLQMAMNVISGVNEANMDLLEVTEKQTYANVMYCISSITHLGLIALSAFTMECSLITFGLIFMVIECLFLFINIFIASTMGWIAPFEHGMFGELILFRDTSVVKQLFWTALPLSFGGLLAYAEWEILTVFAAFLGPAEVVAWTLLGSVWNVFESTTSAIGDASEVRCAFHLGANAPALAKLCAYKCIFLAFMGSLVVTSIFLSLSNVLPAWLSHDATIQPMLSDCFPLIALGNITMDMGMVCWSLVGAQGRYKLATIISTACSLLITIPLGAILTLWLRIDLTGLVFATVLGYTAVAMLLTATLLMSDWRRLAIKIQEKVAVTMEVEEGADEETPGQAELSPLCVPTTNDLEQEYIPAEIYTQCVPTADNPKQEYDPAGEHAKQDIATSQEALDSGESFHSGKIEQNQVEGQKDCSIDSSTFGRDEETSQNDACIANAVSEQSSEVDALPGENINQSTVLEDKLLMDDVEDQFLFGPYSAEMVAIMKLNIDDILVKRTLSQNSSHIDLVNTREESNTIENQQKNDRLINGMKRGQDVSDLDTIERKRIKLEMEAPANPEHAQDCNDSDSGAGDIVTSTSKSTSTEAIDDQKEAIAKPPKDESEQSQLREQWKCKDDQNASLPSSAAWI